MLTRLQNSFANDETLIIGHRGASALAPENTIAAFARAMHDHADGVELDVRLARDGVPVVIHDATLRRTSLSKRMVASLTADELSQTDVGSSFNRKYPRLAREEYSRQVVPTLDQVFRTFNDRPPFEDRLPLIYVEMKCGIDAVAVRDLAQSVVDLIGNHSLASRVIVISFDLPAITQIKQIEPAIRTGALFAPKSKTVIRKPHLLAATVECGADEILVHKSIASRRFTAQAAERDLRPVVWTVDDPKWIGRAQRWGLHALITNNPARFRSRNPSASPLLQ